VNNLQCTRWYRMQQRGKELSGVSGGSSRSGAGPRGFAPGVWGGLKIGSGVLPTVGFLAVCSSLVISGDLLRVVPCLHPYWEERKGKPDLSPVAWVARSFFYDTCPKILHCGSVDGRWRGARGRAMRSRAAVGFAALATALFLPGTAAPRLPASAAAAGAFRCPKLRR